MAKVSVRYRLPNGRWAKKGTPGAEIYGVQEGRKITKVTPETLKPTTVKLGKKAPTLRFQNEKGFISTKAAEALMQTEEFRKTREKKGKELEEKAEKQELVGQEVPFYNLQKTFASLASISKFKSLEITGANVTNKVKRLDQAIKEVSREGYEVAKELDEARRKGIKGESLIIYDIFESSPGEFIIIRLN